MQITQLISAFFRKWSTPLLVLSGLVLFSLVAYYMIQKNQTMEMKKGIQDIANEQERADDVSVLLFAADWCKYCKAAKPVWQAFMKEYDHVVKGTRRIICTTIDCTDPADATSKKLIGQFKVDSFPTILMVKDGRVIRFDASVTKDHLDQFIDKML